MRHGGDAGQGRGAAGFLSETQLAVASTMMPDVAVSSQLLKRRRFGVEDVIRMGQAGLFGDERLELIDGELVHDAG